MRLYQGKYAAAQHVLEQSLAALEKGRGAHHPIVLRTLHNLALALERNKQPRAAGQIWSRAVDLAANSVGLKHPLYGDILSNYAPTSGPPETSRKPSPSKRVPPRSSAAISAATACGVTVDAAAWSAAVREGEAAESGRSAGRA